jgi:hypothetical protein
LALERNCNGSRWARTLLCKDDVGFAGAWMVSLTNSLAVEQNHDVGILLE